MCVHQVSSHSMSLKRPLENTLKAWRCSPVSWLPRERDRPNRWCRTRVKVGSQKLLLFQSCGFPHIVILFSLRGLWWGNMWGGRWRGGGVWLADRAGGLRWTPRGDFKWIPQIWLWKPQDWCVHQTTGKNMGFRLSYAILIDFILLFSFPWMRPLSFKFCFIDSLVCLF